MAEQDKVVDRLRREGDLIRNSGTNSIKSLKDTINVNFQKFDGVFKSIDSNLVKQTQYLDKMVNVQTEMREDARQAAQYDALKPEPETYVRGPDGSKKSTKPTDKRGDGDGFLDELMGSATGYTAAGLLGALVSKLKFGRIALAGGLILAADPLKEFLEGAIGSIFEELDLTEHFSADSLDGVAGAIATSVSWGLLGLFLGKKVALASAIAGLVWGSDIDFGSDLANGVASAVSGALVLFLPGLVGKALKAALSGRAVRAAAAAAGLDAGADYLDETRESRRNRGRAGRGAGNSLGDAATDARRNRNTPRGTVRGKSVMAKISNGARQAAGYAWWLAQRHPMITASLLGAAAGTTLSYEQFQRAMEDPEKRRKWEEYWSEEEQEKRQSYLTPDNVFQLTPEQQAAAERMERESQERQRRDAEQAAGQLEAMRAGDVEKAIKFGADSYKDLFDASSNALPSMNFNVLKSPEGQFTAKQLEDVMAIHEELMKVQEDVQDSLKPRLREQPSAEARSERLERESRNREQAGSSVVIRGGDSNMRGGDTNHTSTTNNYFTNDPSKRLDPSIIP